MNNTYNIKHLEIDFDDHKVTSNDIEMTIDFKAVEVLKMLIDKIDVTVTTDQFMDVIWKDKPSSPEVVPAAIARLRKMFKQAGINDEIIVTVPKVGYRFTPPEIDDLISDAQVKSSYSWVHISLLLATFGSLIASMVFNVKQNKQLTEYQQPTHIQSNDLKITSASETTQLYIIRHAEKVDNTSHNPELSTEGIQRAKYLKSVLKYIAFDQVLTTDYIRNIQTADLITSDSNIEPVLYYPMSFNVLNFLQQVQGQKVLIIGHSNTIPDMVNRLIDEPNYPPMNHDNYNLLYIITINNDGDTSSTLLNIEKL